ncbi:hypothetical protein Q5P01_008258 [Channa striata]|uniref:Transmembrane protein 81 n=1 Tax=Channa striata TaxID=64152 RepID=A0AA88SZD1_CHASR|nr:hypothetical protein Q5P01_008258 [Channa striata]
MTVTSGQRVEIDCLAEVIETMGKLSWRVTWRHVKGVISSDNSLFVRWKAPHLDRVIFDPIAEKDAGTYQCDVQDVNFRRVKIIYWGIRVLPQEFLNLDYDSALAQWQSRDQQNQTVSEPLKESKAVLFMVLMSLTLASCTTGLLLLVIYCSVKRRKRRHFDKQ